ncbi:MAG: ribose 5-phosphate isomerase B [Solirubrobacterales bacterium]
MKIAIASDHAGFELKQQIAAALRADGHDVKDFGTESEASVDYPDFAEPAAREVAVGDAERGVLVCGSGVGVSIVANKVDGVRAVNAHDAEEAAISRQHNDANVVTLGERTTAPDAAIEIVNTFLSTDFEGGRHQERVDKIALVEGHNTTKASAKEIYS